MSSFASSPRPSPCASHNHETAGEPGSPRAVVAVVEHSAALRAHDHLEAALPHASIRTWSTPAGRAVIEEMAHRDLVDFAVRGAVVGGPLVGLMTAAIAYSAAGQNVGVGAGLGMAVALTGGVFFGSLLGFFLGALRWQDAHAGVLLHGRDGAAPGVLVIEGDVDAATVQRVLADVQPVVVETSATDPDGLLAAR